MTELTPNARGVLRSPMGWGKPRNHQSLVLNQMSYPSALQVLAAAEAGLVFWMVKLSGCRDGAE